jgi:hypothetical protein
MRGWSNGRVERFKLASFHRTPSRCNPSFFRLSAVLSAYPLLPLEVPAQGYNPHRIFSGKSARNDD